VTGTTVDGVAISSDDDVLRIVLDRPTRKNALDPAAIARVVTALERASTDDTLRAIVLSSASDDFCTGADWVATNSATGDAQRPRTGSIQRRTPLQAHRLIALLLEVQLPVVCAVRGWAAGLGCQLALAADFTVATASSRFWQPFLDRGFTPDSGATWLLPRLVGVARAKELLLLGRKLTGEEAADWGLIYGAVPDGELDAAVEALVTQLRQAPTVAFGLTKRCIQRALDASLADAMEAEANALELSSRSADFKEGRVDPLRGCRPRRHDHAQPAGSAQRAPSGNDPRAARRVRTSGSRCRRVAAPRHRGRPRVLRGCRRERDPGRRPSGLRRAVSLDE
jgi:2-(1,2-epoxy-1,2-dihydrophenyl)acetyl-CoA isomerase